MGTPRVTTPIPRLAVVASQFIFALLLAGCAVTVDLEPKIEPPPPAEKLPVSVGVYFPPQLQKYEFKTEVKDNGISLTIPLGKASVSLFRKVLPQMFGSVVEVTHRPGPSRPVAGLDAVIEPRIDHFRLEEIQAGTMRYWADIRYRFVVHAKEGGETAAWSVNGHGASPEKKSPTSGGLITEAIERALAVAGARVAASFREVPEAARWHLGQPAGKATAAAAEQVTWGAATTGGNPVGGAYEGAVAVSIAPYRPASFTSEGIQKNERNADVLSLKVAIESPGRRRLLFRRSEIALVFPDGAKLPAVSGARLSARLIRKWKRLRPFAGAPTPGDPFSTALAIVNLVAVSLDLYAAYESETAEAYMYKLVLEREEPTDGILDGGEKMEGYVHFHVQPRRLWAAVDAATLVVPVIELDTMTRYEVALPLNGLKIAENTNVPD